MPKVLRLSRWWLLLIFLLLWAGVEVLVIISARSGPLWDKYQKVQLGMTEEEVEALLGPPTDEDHWTFASSYDWSEGKQAMGVKIELGRRLDGVTWEYVVVKKWFNARVMLWNYRKSSPN